MSDLGQGACRCLPYKTFQGDSLLSLSPTAWLRTLQTIQHRGVMGQDVVLPGRRVFVQGTERRPLVGEQIDHRAVLILEDQWRVVSSQRYGVTNEAPVPAPRALPVGVPH